MERRHVEKGASGATGVFCKRLRLRPGFAAGGLFDGICPISESLQAAQQWMLGRSVKGRASRPLGSWLELSLVSGFGHFKRHLKSQKQPVGSNKKTLVRSFI